MIRWKKMGLLVLTGLSCVPAIDYEKAQQYPLYIRETKIEDVVFKSGDNWKRATFVVTNSTRHNCQLICVEYGAGGRIIEKTCTKIGNYPPSKSLTITALAPKKNPPYSAWCNTNVVPLYK